MEFEQIIDIKTNINETNINETNINETNINEIDINEIDINEIDINKIDINDIVIGKDISIFLDKEFLDKNTNTQEELFSKKNMSSKKIIGEEFIDKDDSDEEIPTTKNVNKNNIVKETNNLSQLIITKLNNGEPILFDFMEKINEKLKEIYSMHNNFLDNWYDTQYLSELDKVFKMIGEQEEEFVLKNNYLIKFI